MAAFYEMEGVLFKPRAYEKAASEIESFDKEAENLWKEKGIKSLLEIPGIGKGIADHMRELFETGHFKEHEQLKKKIPVEISELLAIEGIGPKMIKMLWQELKVRNIADLEKVAKAAKISKLEHFGEKSEKKILKGIALLKKSGGRQILGFLLPEIRSLEKMIRAFPESREVMIAGSIRRKKETIGDIDILVASSKPEKIMQQFMALPFIAHVYGSGKTKTMVKLKNGLDGDIRVVPQKSWGAALNYFTGSKDHNIALREIAIKKGHKLNEYGLFRSADTRRLKCRTSPKEIMVAGRTEEELYEKLGLQYIEPEMREMTGEIEAARANKLPNLVGYGDLKGDLQTQTDWTDGKNSIEEMAHAAKKLGLEYIAITDHTRSLAMTGGSDEKKLERQMVTIDFVNRKFKNLKFKVLKGAEVNIMKDGALDINDKTLTKLDVVGAAIHHYFHLTREEQTARIIRAMENPHVDIIFHLTGRKINQRDPIELDIDEIIKAAKRTGTVLEINAYPDRLDLKDGYIKKCVEAGVKMSIDSDAHSIEHFKLLEHGIAQARRGWAKRSDIINTYPLEKMLKFLKK